MSDETIRQAALTLMGSHGCEKTEDWEMAPAWGCSEHPSARWVRGLCERSLSEARDLHADGLLASPERDATVTVAAWRFAAETMESTDLKSTGLKIAAGTLRDMADLAESRIEREGAES